MRRLVILVAAIASGCAPEPVPAAPILVDSSPDGSCIVTEQINRSRLIRTADASPLFILCDAGDQ